MHSRIFQVSSNPVMEDEKITDTRYEDGFIGSVADYVQPIDEIENDLMWLQTATKGLKIDIVNKTITVESKQDYFEQKFDKFMEYIKQFSDYTLSDFIDDKSKYIFWDLQDSFEEKYSFYIDDNDEYYGITPLDNWVRGVKEGTTYHFGSVFDYHF